jgi:hypothetical protein
MESTYFAFLVPRLLRSLSRPFWDNPASGKSDGV